MTLRSRNKRSSNASCTKSSMMMVAPAPKVHAKIVNFGGDEYNQKSLATSKLHDNKLARKTPSARKSSSSKNQTKSCGKKTAKSTIAPVKPMRPYLRFLKKMWPIITAKDSNMNMRQIDLKICEMWKKLQKREKQKFIDDYEADKLNYNKSLQAYQTKQARKSQKNKSDETPICSTQYFLEFPTADDLHKVEEDYTLAHMNSARFMINQCLMTEIFSNIEPTACAAVSLKDVQVLKSQAEMLMIQQTKHEAELAQMEKDFEEKKQRTLESAAAFEQKVQDCCKPAMLWQLFCEDSTAVKVNPVKIIYPEV